jgi:AcrR family transcriptional regulator
MTDSATPNSSKRRYHAPVRQAQVELTRGRVLAAADRVFREHGYAAATMTQIAAAADVSVPTIYGTVGGKADLLTALMLGLMDEVNIREQVKELMTCADPVELLRRGAAATVSFNLVAWELQDSTGSGAV